MGTVAMQTGAARRPGRRATAATRAAVPQWDRWLITAFLLVLIAPPEAQFELGSLVLSPQRVALMIGLPLALVRVISDPRLGPRLADCFVLAHVVWAAVSLAKVHGINAGSIEAAGSYWLECLGSYLIGRALTRSPAHIYFFARRLLLLVLVLAIFAIPEMLTGRHFIREGFGAILGPRSLEGVTDRFGLTRAFSSFDHPILFGVFCASALGLVWYLTPSRVRLGFPRLWRAVAVVATAFASLSTGPLMACTVQIGLIGWDIVTRGIRWRWWILLGCMAVSYVAIDALSNRDPVTVFISYATFNPQTGYDRKLIWDIGVEQVRLTPLFGIGMNLWTTAPEWWHNTSVDNFWLLTTLRYGIPGLLALLAAWALAIRGVVRLPYRPLRPLMMGWLVSFVGVSIAAITVHLWGSAFMLFGFLLGLGVSLGHFRPPARPPTASVVREESDS